MKTTPTSRVKRTSSKGLVSGPLGRVVTILSILIFYPGTTLGLDLGLTPNHVYSIWKNINGALVSSARTQSNEQSLEEEMSAMQIRRFQGKRPSDVLFLVQEVRGKIDRLRAQSALSPTQGIKKSYVDVTPSVVYLTSGRLLAALMEWLVQNTGPSQLISPFFVRHRFSEKTPSDVFGLVDLANRRLDLILSRTSFLKRDK